VSDGWSFGGSILTFAFPMLLFIAVAAALYVLYTKPAFVPGHRSWTPEHPVSYTAIPGSPTATEADAGVVGGENKADAGVVGGENKADAGVGGENEVPGNPAADAAMAADDGQNPAPEVQL
jgi:hypothetical protein